MLENMARPTIAAWLSRVAAGEVLRAYRLLRVAHGDAILVRRRYLRNGAIVEMQGVSVDEEDAVEHSVGRWTDLDAERARLRAAGWDLSGDPGRR